MDVSMKRRNAQSLSAGPRSALLALAAVLALLGTAVCGGSSDDSPDTGASRSSGAMTVEVATDPDPAVGHSVGNLAPDFTVETAAGETFALSKVTAAGSPVLLYFFTTW